MKSPAIHTLVGGGTQRSGALHMAKANDVAKDWGLGSKTRAKANPPGPPRARPVVKADHIPKKEQATPETKRKLQPDFLEKLLRLGPAEGGIDEQTFEALFEIEEAHAVVGRRTAARASSLELAGGGDPGSMSDGEARTWSIWLEWAKEFYRQTGVTGAKIAELIEARFPVDATFVGHYRRAAGLWDKTKRDLDKGA